MTKVIAVFDPGNTTGVCIVVLPDAVNAQTKFRPRFFELPLDDESFMNMGTIMANMGVDLILIEEFALRPDAAPTQVGSVFPSSKATGKIELLAYMLAIKVVYRKPIHMKPFAHVSDLERFLTMGLPHSEHMRDAFRHFLSFTFSQNK